MTSVRSKETEAALPLPQAEFISKPDIAATDCGVTTFFAQIQAKAGNWRFCGTSAAAPMWPRSRP